MPTDEATDLIELTREICARTSRRGSTTPSAPPRTFPEETFRTLGRAGLLSLPYPEEFGGAGQPYEVYLQVVEEIASVWMSVAVGVSVHSLTCYPVATFGTRDQQEALLPAMLSGEQLGAYCLSEPLAGSDIASMTTRATDAPTPACVPAQGHQGLDLARRPRRLLHDLRAHVRRRRRGPVDASSCRVTPRAWPSPSPRRRWACTATPSRRSFRGGRRRRRPARRRARARAWHIALSALDSGRLGIAAAATGLAQAALDAGCGLRQASASSSVGAIGDYQGLAFLLADMEAAVTSARATYLHAARLKDAGRAFSKEAAVAKLVATDNAMKVTTDAVQVLGGAGYTQDFPLERYMREAKVTQIFEGTNQIQRLVISRQLLSR